MPELHFLRPFWLALLPVALLLPWFWYRRRGQVGNWANVIAPALLPFVVSQDAGTGRLRRLAAAGGALALVMGVLALSGPAWDRLPTPALRSAEAMVIALDLSRSMDATDTEPSRIERAKLKVYDLLERRANGQTALVVFSAHAFTVTPLTNDVATIAALVGSLTTDIMPSRGSYPDAGINKAVELLKQAGVPSGDILLITDAEVEPQTQAAVRDAYQAGHRVHVLGVGTAAGGPIPRSEGGFVTDAAGAVVVPRLAVNSLRRLAGQGGGVYTTLTADDSDIARLLARTNSAGDAVENPETARVETVLWHDRGPYLVLLLLPLMLYAFRRGLIAVWLLLVLLPPGPAQALSWDELWRNSDQRAAEALEAGDPAVAAELFDDPRWRAAALYRAGEFPASADALEGLETADDYYNRGNALAYSGDFQAALSAYEQAIQLDADHEDAIFNRDLLLEQMPPAEQQSEGQQGEDGQPGDQGQQGQPSDNDDSADSQPESQQDDSEQSGEQPSAEEQSADESEQRQDPTQNAAEENLDEWASEQAADQWLRRIPDDPGGLLRRKFRYQYQRLGRDQDGNSVWPGDEERPY